MPWPQEAIGSHTTVESWSRSLPVEFPNPVPPLSIRDNQANLLHALRHRHSFSSAADPNETRVLTAALALRVLMTRVSIDSTYVRGQLSRKQIVKALVKRKAEAELWLETPHDDFKQALARTV